MVGRRHRRAVRPVAGFEQKTRPAPLSFKNNSILMPDPESSCLKSPLVTPTIRDISRAYGGINGCLTVKVYPRYDEGGFPGTGSQG